MDRTRSRAVKTIKGKGNVDHEDQLAFNAYYELTVLEDVVSTKTYGKSEEAVGNEEVVGFLKTDNPHVLHDYVGKELTLHLADGRRLKITLTNHTGSVRALGPFF